MTTKEFFEMNVGDEFKHNDFTFIITKRIVENYLVENVTLYFTNHSCLLSINSKNNINPSIFTTNSTKLPKKTPVEKVQEKIVS